MLLGERIRNRRDNNQAAFKAADHLLGLFVQQVVELEGLTLSDAAAFVVGN